MLLYQRKIILPKEGQAMTTPPPPDSTLPSPPSLTMTLPPLIHRSTTNFQPWKFGSDSILLLSISSKAPFDAGLVISCINPAEPFFSLCFNLEKMTKKHLGFQLFKTYYLLHFYSSYLGWLSRIIRLKMENSCNNQSSFISSNIH